MIYLGFKSCSHKAMWHLNCFLFRVVIALWIHFVFFDSIVSKLELLSTRCNPVARSSMMLVSFLDQFNGKYQIVFVLDQRRDLSKRFVIEINEHLARAGKQICQHPVDQLHFAPWLTKTPFQKPNGCSTSRIESGSCCRTLRPSVGVRQGITSASFFGLYYNRDIGMNT